MLRKRRINLHLGSLKFAAGA